MNDPWFVVKRYGLGLSPNGWKGWTVTALYIVLISLVTVWVQRTGASALALALATMAFVLLSFVLVMLLTSDRKPWRWRWGNDDTLK